MSSASGPPLPPPPPPLSFRAFSSPLPAPFPPVKSIPIPTAAADPSSKSPSFRLLLDPDKVGTEAVDAVPSCGATPEGLRSRAACCSNWKRDKVPLGLLALGGAAREGGAAVALLDGAGALVLGSTADADGRRRGEGGRCCGREGAVEVSDEAYEGCRGGFSGRGREDSLAAEPAEGGGLVSPAVEEPVGRRNGVCEDALGGWDWAECDELWLGREGRWDCGSAAPLAGGMLPSEGRREATCGTERELLLAAPEDGIGPWWPERCDEEDGPGPGPGPGPGGPLDDEGEGAEPAWESTEKPTRTRSDWGRPRPATQCGVQIGSDCSGGWNCQKERRLTGGVFAPTSDKSDEELSLLRGRKLGIVAVRLVVDDQDELEGLRRGTGGQIPVLARECPERGEWTNMRSAIDDTLWTTCESVRA